MKNEQGSPEKNTIFISTLNAVIDDLQRVLDKYKDAQLAFATDIYSSGNGDIFERDGRMDYYQDEVREMISLLEKQIENLKVVRRQIKP